MSRPVLPVSLCLTTLNEARSITAFFDSVREQTALPAEIVVCDGGSRDGTADLVETERLDGVDITVLRAPGSNIARGRNLAIEAARHEWIAVSDAGCTLAPNWLDRLTAPLRAGATFAAGGYELRAETPFERAAAAAELDIERVDPAEFLPSSRSVAFRKGAWRDAGMYPEELTFAGEDTAFCINARAAGHTIVPALDARVYWRPRSNLRAYVRQHRLYGYGDAEARNKGRVYLKIAVKFLLAAAALLAACFDPRLIVLSLAGLLLYAVHLGRIYRWSAIPLPRAAAACVLIMVKEGSLLAGYLQAVIHGAFRRQSGR
ncbi:MAG: glycosyltransferase [Ignavibacteriae bacterium]|nr:glycosyltransferase [Ignavibacteriota bacterium]